MFTLPAEKREIFGKKLRGIGAVGKLPAVLYGPGKETISIFVSAQEFDRAYETAGESSVISLRLAEGVQQALISEVARHPLTGQFLHADFYAIEADRPVEVEVPLVFSGEAPAVKEAGASLVKVLHELEVRAKPACLPRELLVSLDSLINSEAVIRARDIVLPTGVELLTEADEVVAAISIVGAEEEESKPMDISKIEVEKRGKKEEEISAESEGGQSGGKAEAKS